MHCASFQHLSLLLTAALHCTRLLPLQFLFQCSLSEHPGHREVALIVFTSLTDAIGNLLRPHFRQLTSIFVNALSDQAQQVSRSSLTRALGLGV